MADQSHNDTWDKLDNLINEGLNPDAPPSDRQWSRLAEIAANTVERTGGPFVSILPRNEGEERICHVLRQSLVALVQTAQLLSPIERDACGKLLAKLGDPRPGVGVRNDGVPDIVWCEVPAGEFMYQQDERLSLPTFKIAKYPITYRQFQAFVNTPGGYWDATWWQNMPANAVRGVQKLLYSEIETDSWAHELPKDDSRQIFQLEREADYYSNHPYVNVTWFEAAAFCRWLSAKLGDAIRLPTQQEWEKAARGTDGRLYPYGNEYDPTKANTRETRIHLTTTVGLFPDGASPYDVLDMSGNVWEWMLNEFDGEIGSNIYNSSVDRSLRGGSYYYGSDETQATYRGDNPPSDPRRQFGFRVVRGGLVNATIL